jgi:hypothetical protein
MHHTWISLTTKDPKDIGNPRGIADALRVHSGLWERLRPLVIEELADTYEALRCVVSWTT